MKRLALTTCILLLCAATFAQQRHNYLAVNGAVLDDVGPYYFIAQGDNVNAFARAALLADAMGLSVDYLAESKSLVFSDGRRSASFRATADVAAGLPKRDGTVTLEPPLRGVASLASPMAILVDGMAYVPISPLVAAFEGQSDWNAERRIVTVDTADRLGFHLEAPRTGLTGGVSRVAVDLPPGAAYEVAAGGSTLVIALPGARAESFQRALDDPNLRSVRLNSSGAAVTLVIETMHPLDPGGRGFTVGSVDKDSGMTLYVDFGPQLTNRAVTALGAPTPSEPQALAIVPEVRQVVVIDAGHGGHDPGTSSAHAVERTVVLSVALKLKQLLEREGIEVILTRDHDTFIELRDRSTFATPDRNIFVSIHANSAPSTSANGIETWVFGAPLNPSLIEQAIRENGGGAQGQALTEAAREAADALAFDILRESQLSYSMALAETVQAHLVEATGARDRGVRQNLFYVLRNSRIPAILVELGFVSNAEEGRRLATESYQRKLAEALAVGILEFLQGGGVLARR